MRKHFYLFLSTTRFSLRTQHPYFFSSYFLSFFSFLKSSSRKEKTPLKVNLFLIPFWFFIFLSSFVKLTYNVFFFHSQAIPTRSSTSFKVNLLNHPFSLVVQNLISVDIIVDNLNGMGFLICISSNL